MKNDIVIKSEEDAYELLKRCLKEQPDIEGLNIKFEGWPKLHLHLDGRKYKQTITPTMMRGFLELQKSIYRSYALSRYNSPNINSLGRKEKEDLEIEVKVTNGSSNYEIDLQQIIFKIIESVGDKMEPVHVVSIVLGWGVLYFGHSSLRNYLEQRKDIRKEEIRSEDQRETIAHLKFASEQETERAKIIADLVKKEPQVKNFERGAHDTHTALLKSMTSADSGEIMGVEIDANTARELTTNARKKSEEIRLDGRFKITRVDSSNPSEFVVRIRNIKSDDVIEARVQDAELNEKIRLILQTAEWQRKPVDLKINAKELRGIVRDAIIIEVEEVMKVT